MKFGYGADEGEGGDVCGELWPGLEGVFAGEDELGVGEGEGCGSDFGEGEFVECGVVAVDAFERGGVGGAMRVEEVLGLFFVLLEARVGRVAACQTYEAPFGCCLESARVRLKEDSSDFGCCCRWARPFPRTGCALRAVCDGKGFCEGCQLGVGWIAGFRGWRESLAKEQKRFFPTSMFFGYCRRLRGKNAWRRYCRMFAME